MVEVIPIEPLVALIAGALILLIPRLLNYIVALYLVVIGLLGLLSSGAGTDTLAPAASRLTIPVPLIETGFNPAPPLRSAEAGADST